MNMMTPVPATTPAAPPAVAPVRPVADAAFARNDPGDDQPDDGRRQGTETTLRYKFDWLVQRQVNAGTIDADEAAEMIRLFATTVKDGTGRDARPSATPPPAGDAAAAPRGTDAASALLDRLRDRFGVDGPYDDHGDRATATPTGVIVDDQA